MMAPDHRLVAGMEGIAEPISGKREHVCLTGERVEAWIIA
jgi:hypothetical protein